MGVQLYFPRVVLPGAKPSPDYDLVDIPQAAAEIIPHTQKKTMPAVSDPVTDVAEEITDHQDQPGSELEETPGVLPEEEPIADDFLRFNLRYYRINQQLAVIDELPHQHAGAANADTITLLRNILHAVKVDTSQCEFKGESFSWPLAEGLSVNTKPAVAAKQALQGFISMRKQLDDFSNLLVFAAQVDDLLLDADKQSEDRDFKVDNSDYFLTLTSSLQSILAFPFR